MTHSKNVKVLTHAGYTITHCAECYTLSKVGGAHGKGNNSYHSTLDNAVVDLAEKLIPEKIAGKADYHATLAELVEIVQEVRREITSALTMAGIGGGSENSENPDINTAVKPRGCLT